MREMILLVVFDATSIFCTILFFSIMKKRKNADAIIKNNDDGSTTIYINNKVDWKIITFYLLFTLTSNLIILSIIKIVEYINVTNVLLKYKILIIVVFDIIGLILLFPSLTSALINKIIKCNKKSK